MKEEVASNSVSGGGVDMNPNGRPKHKEFNVSADVFRKFETGRMKFERWSKFLDEEDDNQMSIKLYAAKNRGHTIILRNEETGALRAIRRRSSNGL
ncbi:MAG: hypothetical protein HOK52_14830 [Candidatus Marinimicrobia bacterium]|jgi:hypothetical protein|nr:hypothetical protein [Candidatus Neomarinimicrobiota bacterium]